MRPDVGMIRSNFRRKGCRARGISYCIESDCIELRTAPRKVDMVFLHGMSLSKHGCKWCIVFPQGILADTMISLDNLAIIVSCIAILCKFVCSHDHIRVRRRMKRRTDGWLQVETHSNEPLRYAYILA